MGESAVGWANCRVGARASRRGVEGRARWLSRGTNPLCLLPLCLKSRASPPRHVAGSAETSMPTAARLLGVPRRAAQLSHMRSLSSAAKSTAHLEMGVVLDRFSPARSWLKGWSNFSVSTLAVVTLRKDVEGWGVPRFKAEAAKIYSDVGVALASGDEAALRQLTTPSCFAELAASVRARPVGQRHRWETLSCTASVVQVRVGHHASNPERRFAQVTCAIDASLVWTISDKKGVVVSGLGSSAEPYRDNNVWWVFERCISLPAEPPAWRLKEQIRPPADETAS